MQKELSAWTCWSYLFYVSKTFASFLFTHPIRASEEDFFSPKQSVYCVDVNTKNVWKWEEVKRNSFSDKPYVERHEDWSLKMDFNYINKMI